MRRGMTYAEAGKLGYIASIKNGNNAWVIRHNKAKDAYEASPKYCLYCGNRLCYEDRTKKFCNHSCCASFNNKKIGLRVDKPCKVCGSECHRSGRGRIYKFCLKCLDAGARYGKIFKLEDCKTDQSRKNWMLKNREHKCAICSLFAWQGQNIPLELDHIDGNSDNNLESNLRLICPNCHAQTPTYKNKNHNRNTHRQEMRRKRYKEGKTY